MTKFCQYPSMLPLNLEQTLEISGLCKSILQIDKGVICVSVINKRGRIIESESRAEDLLRCLSKTEIEMLYMQRALQTSMIRELDRKHGGWNCTVTERDFVTEVILPLGEGLVFVMLDSGAKTDCFMQTLKQTIVSRMFSRKASLVLH